MRNLLWPVLLLITLSGQGLRIAPGQRSVLHFEVHGESRLVALAKLGALTNTTLLVEAGTMSFLQMPVELSANASTVSALIGTILEGSEPYAIREQGSLLIVSAANARSRIPTMPLGRISFSGKSLSSLYPLLEYYVRLASGCKPRGFGYVGPPLDVDIPPFELAAGTFEQVVVRVAEAREASMWIIEPDPIHTGCINNPAAHWEVGLYGFGRLFSGCETPFREAIGPSFVVGRKELHTSGMDCIKPQLPQAVPTFPPTQR